MKSLHFSLALGLNEEGLVLGAAWAALAFVAHMEQVFLAKKEESVDHVRESSDRSTP